MIAVIVSCNRNNTNTENPISHQVQTHVARKIQLEAQCQQLLHTIIHKKYMYLVNIDYCMGFSLSSDSLAQDSIPAGPHSAVGRAPDS